MFNKNLFAHRLNQLRLQQGLSMQALAEVVGLKNKSSIALFESKSSAPSADVLVALADYFGVSLDYLAGRSDDPRREEYEPIRLQKERAEIIAKETALLETLPASLLPAYNEAREKNKKNPENLQQIIDTFARMAKDYHSLTK